MGGTAKGTSVREGGSMRLEEIDVMSSSEPGMCTYPRLVTADDVLFENTCDPQTHFKNDRISRFACIRLKNSFQLDPAASAIASKILHSLSTSSRRFIYHLWSGSSRFLEGYNRFSSLKREVTVVVRPMRRTHRPTWLPGPVTEWPGEVSGDPLFKRIRSRHYSFGSGVGLSSNLPPWPSCQVGRWGWSWRDASPPPDAASAA
eukprot:524378-Hanusia_phi.AAC.1